MPPIEGIDVSGGAQGPIRWAEVARDGIAFAYLKATEGSSFVDRYYARNKAGCRENGIVSGAYHFWRHDVDPEAQARNFLRTIGAVGPGDLPPMLDVEGPGDHAGPIRFPISELPARLQVFLEAVDAATGRRTGVYTYRHVWQVTFGNPTAFRDRPLWYADYTPPPDNLPGGWQRWHIWQYTSTGRVAGIDTRVDKNRWAGSMEELRRWAGLPDERRVVFPQTGKGVQGGFLDYFEEHGGVGALGYPLTEEEPGDAFPYSLLPELRPYTVQLFEHDLLIYRAGEGVKRGRMGALVEELRVDADR